MKATKEQIKYYIKFEEERREILKDSLGRYNEEEEVFERVSKAFIKALRLVHDVKKAFKFRCSYLDKNPWNLGKLDLKKLENITTNIQLV